MVPEHFYTEFMNINLFFIIDIRQCYCNAIVLPLVSQLYFVTIRYWQFYERSSYSAVFQVCGVDDKIVLAFVKILK